MLIFHTVGVGSDTSDVATLGRNTAPWSVPATSRSFKPEPLGVKAVSIIDGALTVIAGILFAGQTTADEVTEVDQSTDEVAAYQG